jgi:hypothetical protein
MSALASEWEVLHELGPAHECEGECEFESEPFLGGLARLAMRGLQSPALRQVALAAGRAALNALTEGEGAGEGELNPVRRVYPDAALEHMAHAAMHAESEAEAAEAFLPLIPMIAAKLLPLAAKALPLAAKALPKVLSAVSRVAPQLTRGVSRIAGTLYRNPQTRALLRTVPTIARRTMSTLARQAARGQPVTPQTAVRTLARQAAALIDDPRRCAGTIRRARLMDRQYHRAIRPRLIGRACGCRCPFPQGEGESEFWCLPYPGCAKMTDPDTGATICQNLGACRGKCSLHPFGWCCCT